MSEALSDARTKIEKGPTKSSFLAYCFVKYVARTAFFLYFRLFVRNAKALPKKGPVIVSPVHRSNLDVPMVGAFFQRRLHYLGKGSLMTNRFSAWFLKGCGMIPLDRDSRADKLALDASLKALKEGKALAVFPEGERKSGSTVFPMLDGAVWLSAKTNAPILPVGNRGSELAMPKGVTSRNRVKSLSFTVTLSLHHSPKKDLKRVSRSELTKCSEDLHTIHRSF